MIMNAVMPQCQGGKYWGGGVLVCIFIRNFDINQRSYIRKR